MRARLRQALLVARAVRASANRLEWQETDHEDQQDLIALFKQVATEVDKREFADVTGESVITDLGIDSLSMMQIVGEMEHRLDIMIPDEDLVELVTVADLVKVVERRLEGS